MISPASDTFNNLSNSLEGHGYDVVHASTLTALAQQLGERLPSCLLANASSISRESLDRFYADQGASAGDALLLVVGASDSFAERLNAVRLGAVGFFSGAGEHDAVTRHLDSYHSATMTDVYRVLIVDDEVSLANHHAVILRNAGVATDVVTDPKALMDAMETFNPDVVLMDLYMPSCSGVELTNMIKMHESFLTVPIVYLSAEADPAKQLTTLERSGGEDFLTKPISPEHLVRAVRSRASRARRVEARAIFDRLTGTLNLNATEMMLKNEILRACQVGIQISIALVEVDEYSAIETQYGEKNANRVLRRFARLARENCANIPIGRFGEKEFLMVFFGTDVDEAMAMMQLTTEAFALQRYKLPGNQMFGATVSAGMASIYGCANVEKLCEVAAKSLFQARDAGGGCVVLHTLPPTS